MNLSKKVALVTGGLSGIGAICVEQFLKNAIKAVVIADISKGEEISRNLNAKYGKGRVTFVKTDVSDRESFGNAFQKTIDTYNNIDILINSAGTGDENNWLRLILVNLVGTALGCELAMRTYFPKYKSGANAYIINIASIAGLLPYRGAPHYAASKHGVVGLTKSYGRNKVTIQQNIFVMALCPGPTDTPMLDPELLEKTLYGDQLVEDTFSLSLQGPEAVSRSAVEILQKPEHGSIWVINQNKLSKKEAFTYSTLTTRL